jgi:KaiC/GvpD/RAD55 family RecA-like ATPase
MESDMRTQQILAEHYKLAANIKVESWDDCAVTATKWVIKGLIPDNEVTVIYGPSGSGKTYFTAYACMCVMSGLPVLREDAKIKRQGRVAYVAAEKVGSIKKRFAQMRKYDKFFSDAEFRNDSLKIFSGNIALLDDEQFRVFSEALLAQYSVLDGDGDNDTNQPVLLVIDTLSAAFAGIDENTSQMAKVVERCKDLSSRLGNCAVIIVHHSGTQEGRERGHTSLRGNVSQTLQVSGMVNPRKVEVQKVTDEAAGSIFEFDIVGGAGEEVDDDGLAIPIAFIQRSAFDKKESISRKKLNANGSLVMQAWAKAWDSRGEAAVVSVELLDLHIEQAFSIVSSKKRKQLVENGLKDVVTKYYLVKEISYWRRCRNDEVKAE